MILANAGLSMGSLFLIGVLIWIVLGSLSPQYQALKKALNDQRRTARASPALPATAAASSAWVSASASSRGSLAD